MTRKKMLLQAAMKQQSLIVIENKFKEGEVVFERTHPARKLVIGHYTDNIYYCKAQENTTRNHLVYFERELLLDGSALRSR
jgi:hypothetical protein